MFSGIVDHTGDIQSIELTSHGMTLWIRSAFADYANGESIAVDGVCLTVVDSNDEGFCCELSPETLQLTIADTYQVGTRVNLERALCMGDAIGGHCVTGHCDSLATVDVIQTMDEFTCMHFIIDSECRRYLMNKGSVAINGVSLTVNQVDEIGFNVMLIPHTLERTTLSQLKTSDHVNIEYDQFIKAIARQFELYNNIRVGEPA